MADARDYIYVSKNTNSFFSFLYLYLEFNIIITKHTQFPYNSNHYNFYFQPLLKPLTEREGYSYEKIAENLQRGLYIPYTKIAKALRLFTNIPSVYYKCETISSSSESTKSKKEVKTFKPHATWPFTTDQDLSHLKEHLEYLNNGHDYIISIKPQALCEVNESKNNLIETLIESQNYLKTLKGIVPKSEVKSILNVIDSYITTAFNLSRSPTFTSGAAEITFLDVPQHVASSGRAPPSKRRHSSEMQHDDDSEICTALAENQCSCREFFQDINSLDIHMKAVHLPCNWSCPHTTCDKFGHPHPNRYSLWKHIRTHHLKTFNYHCKEHEFRCEESGYYKKHLDKYHGITSDLRCPNKEPCKNKLYGTKAKLVAHMWKKAKTT